VAEAFGGRHVSAGEFRDSGMTLDLEQAARRLRTLCDRVLPARLRRWTSLDAVTRVWRNEVHSCPSRHSVGE
jgi:hypothetical protein